MRIHDIVIQLKAFFRTRSFLSNIILINVAIWVVMLFLDIVGFLFSVGDGGMERVVYD